MINGERIKPQSQLLTSNILFDNHSWWGKPLARTQQHIILIEQFYLICTFVPKHRLGVAAFGLPARFQGVRQEQRVGVLYDLQVSLGDQNAPCQPTTCNPLDLNGRLVLLWERESDKGGGSLKEVVNVEYVKVLQ